MKKFLFILVMIILSLATIALGIYGIIHWENQELWIGVTIGGFIALGVSIILWKIFKLFFLVIVLLIAAAVMAVVGAV